MATCKHDGGCEVTAANTVVCYGCDRVVNLATPITIYPANIHAMMTAVRAIRRYAKDDWELFYTDNVTTERARCVPSDPSSFFSIVSAVQGQRQQMA